MKPSEQAIQDAIYWPLHERGNRYICPNFTPYDWWECDMFAITKSGFWVEYEIKVTLSDFRNDVKKAKDFYTPKTEPSGYKFYERKSETKHSLLSEKSTRGPSRFFYIVPNGLVTLDQVPEWAGLIEAHPHRQGSTYFLHEIKRAPILHRQEASEKLRKQVKEAFYWRYWNMRHANKTPWIPETADHYSI